MIWRTWRVLGGMIEHCAADVVNGKCGVADAIVDGPMGLRVLANRGGVCFATRDASFGETRLRVVKTREQGSSDCLVRLIRCAMRSIWLWWMRVAD